MILQRVDKMKNKLIIGIVLLGIFTFSNCKSPDKNDIQTLTVTIEPQKCFLETIVGEHYKVNCIISSGMNPESADFTPAQMMSLDKSVAYFKIGYLGIENALIGKVIPNNPTIKIVDCSNGIEPIGEAHIHDEHGACEHHEGHQGGDPHTWSSVKSAKIIAENMYNALLEIDKANEADYTINYKKLIAEFDRTDSIIKSHLDKSSAKAFIIYHPALSYFAEEYGLTQYSIETDGKNPSPSQLKELIDRAKKENVKVVFIQEEFDTKNAETVAEAIGGKTVSINLMSYNWSDEMIKIAKALTLQNE